MDIYEVENSFTVSALCARIANVAHLQQFAATGFGCSLEKLDPLLTQNLVLKSFVTLLFSIGGFQIPDIDRKTSFHRFKFFAKNHLKSILRNLPIKL